MPRRDTINRQEMAASYGFAVAFLNSDPELRRLFNQAVKNTWSAAMFQARLRGTKWFKTHSAPVRNAIMQKTADPATYKANVDKMTATVRDTWAGMFGAGAAPMSHKEMRTWAETAHRMGWSEAQLIDQMTRGVNYQKLLKKKSLGGTAAEVAAQMDSLAANYGVPLGNKWRARQLEKIIEGGDTIEGVQKRVRDVAMREYKAFADRIAAGETVAEIADPYVQQMAELLELNENDINIRSPHIQRALKQTTKQGKPAAMDLNSFADVLRRDKRWKYTDNAKKQVAEATEGLLRQWGVMS